MKKIDNIKLLDFSIKNPEPIIDDYYLKDNFLIISEDPNNRTELMQSNLDLIESITAYSFALKNKNKAMLDKATEKILEVVKSKNINYSEFVSFWPVVDISHSVFEKIEDSQKINVLKSIIEKYIKFRHNLYLKHGYSSTSLQVSKDAKTHKQGGNLGINKVSKILETFDFKNANSESIEDFIKGDKKYIQTDKKGKKLFKELLKYYKIKFSWSGNKENKMPDFLIRHKKDIFILEHKHKKEGGGGQNGQLNEIISLIGFKEKNLNVHFVSFLDGVYFNTLTDSAVTQAKIMAQIKNIKTNLKNNSGNYFVNTAGFKELLKKL